MDEGWIWAIAGLVLIIIELLSGTFYLLVLGVAAFGSSGAALLGGGFAVQALVFVVASALGCYWVHAYRLKNAAQQMAPVDAGQPASFEQWVDAQARLARVRYRGASWEAQIDGEGGEPAPGALLYVLSANGNTLKVSTRRPG